MNFSIPDDLKARFNLAFADDNKSAIVAKLLEEAIARAERKKRSDRAVEQVLAIRGACMPVSTEAILRARDDLRAEATHHPQRDQ